MGRRVLLACTARAVWALLPLLLVVAAFAQEPASSPRSGVPVRFNGHTLFSVYSDLGPFSPADRARAIEERLRDKARDASFSPDRFAVRELDGRSDITADGASIATVTDADAQAAGNSPQPVAPAAGTPHQATAQSVGSPRQAVALDYSHRMAAAVREYRTEHSARNLARGFFRAALAVIGFCLFLMVLGKAAAWLRVRISAAWEGRERGIRYQTLELLTPERVRDILLVATGGIRLLAGLIAFYVCLTLVFGSFPWTQGFARVLLEYVAARLAVVGASFVAAAPNVTNIVIIAVVTYYILKLIRFVLGEVEKGAITLGPIDRDLARPTYRILRYLALAGAAVAIFPYIPGSKSRAFEGISVFFGLLISLGSSSAVSNIVAGIVLTYMRPFQIGDRVKIGDTVGDVVDRTDLVTRIRTIKNVVVTIPNGMLLGTHIVNYSAMARADGLILHTSVTIGYDVPWRQVHELLIAAARQTSGILAGPEPFVLQTALNDFNVAYEINGYTDRPGAMAAILSELHRNIQDRFAAAGVEIMSPHYASLRDGNAAALPPDSLPPDYAAPAFRIVVDPEG